MIGIIFDYAGQIIEVRVLDCSLFFRTSQQQWADINGIKFDKTGTLKEFPDLVDKDDWKNIAKERLKEKIKKMDNENERAMYVIEELSKKGYKPLYYQKAGQRRIKL